MSNVPKRKKILLTGLEPATSALEVLRAIHCAKAAVEMILLTQMEIVASEGKNHIAFPFTFYIFAHFYLYRGKYLR